MVQKSQWTPASGGTQGVEIPVVAYISEARPSAVVYVL